MGSTALAMDVGVSIILQVTGVYLALKGYADHVHAAGFPPLMELQETFFEAGGKLMVCSPCMQARKITPEDLANLEYLAGLFEEGRFWDLLAFALENAEYLEEHFSEVLQTVEPYWGLVRSDGTHKPGWDTFQAIAGP